MKKKSDYYEKLKDPRWQKKRLEILERDGWRCTMCKAKDRTLNVHHIAYFSGYEPWEVPSGFLATLCEKCHSENSAMFLDGISLILDHIFSVEDGPLTFVRLFKIGKSAS